MAISYKFLTKRHPCFALGNKDNKNGRIHLPTSPTCNIQCRFCERSINSTENRPGVSSLIIKPNEAIDIINRALTTCPEITVVGIAGPGDTLASPYALETFRLVKKEYPNLIKCMSTNGLLLIERADEIIDVGIDSLTVTVNAVDPKIEAQLNKGITYHGKYYGSEAGARILIKNQLAGIRKIADAGITVKINTVLVPKINGKHIEAIAKAISEAGALIYNIIPLIPMHELKGEAAPTCTDLFRARIQAKPFIDVFHHCQRCRADAVGIPGGKDISDQIYLKRVVGGETFSHG